MKILMVGGTGIISTAVTEEILKRGYELTLLNRGSKPVPKGVQSMIGDINDQLHMESLLENKSYDVIIDWIAYTVEDVERDYQLFNGHTKQYIYISSASAYKKPLPKEPITEDWDLDNIYWTYSKNKQLSEERLRELESVNFPVTIIRPSHTYNEKMLIVQVKSHLKPFGILNRIENDKPVVLPDKGTNLWTITSNTDFSKAFVDVIGNDKTYGETYHLTGDKTYNWKDIMGFYYKAFDKEPNIVYVPMDELLTAFPEFRGELLGDKDKDTVFDNSKIKAIAPNYSSTTNYEDVAPKVVEYYKNHPELHCVDEAFEKRLDALIKKMKNS